jgi:hypothetical protein
MLVNLLLWAVLANLSVQGFVIAVVGALLLSFLLRPALGARRSL